MQPLLTTDNTADSELQAPVLVDATAADMTQRLEELTAALESEQPTRRRQHVSQPEGAPAPMFG